MMDSVRSEQSALIALLRARPGRASWPELAAMSLEAGSAIRVWEAVEIPSLMKSPGEADLRAQAAADLASWSSEGLRVLTVLDDDYPLRLRGVHQAPPILFARGDVCADDRAVSVVGSRQASERGISVAAGVAKSLVKEGYVVLSGLAEGIDSAAHRAALDVNGRTVAIIGTGIHRYFPAKNRGLQQLIERQGLVLSQFWPDAPPTKATFPMRNATMSGYGLATVVVEAGERSGARIQARVAVEHGRPVILTDMVVSNNEWARALVERPGVHVASGLREVLELVRAIDQDRADITNVLHGLAPA